MLPKRSGSATFSPSDRFWSKPSPSGTKLEIVTNNNEVLENIKSEFLSHTFIENGYYKVDYINMSKAEFDTYLDSKKEELLSGNLDAVIYVPDSALADKKIEYYSKNPNNRTVFDKLKDMINVGLVNTYFEGRNFSTEDVDFASASVWFYSFRVSSDEGVEEEGYGNMIASFLFTFLLYFSLIFLGNMMMGAVVEEKTSKIVEVLLSSCSPQDLMTGKIFGSGITGVIQMAIWLMPVVILLTTSIFTLPPDFNLRLDPWMILYFLVNYAIGLFTFLGLYASVGSMFNNEKEAQTGMWPVMMLIMIPFFIAITAQSNPEGAWVQVTSLIPFASIIVLPARMTLVEIPLWEVFLALVINLITFVCVFIMAGKIYRIGILQTGKKPSLTDIIKWIRY